MKNYLIKGGKILVFKDDVPTVEERPLYIEQGRILFDPSGEERDYETVDAGGMLVMPGLINMHTHSYMSLMRNYADDVAFSEWLFSRVMPVEDRLPADAAYWGCLLGNMEMIATGTTCFMDMHMYHRQSALAARQSGMRAFIGRGLVGDDFFEEGNVRFKEALEEKAEFESDLLDFVLAPHAIYTCSENLLLQVDEQAKRLGMLKEIHLSESVTEVEDCLKAHGKTPVKYLADLGFLDSKTLLAHCVQMQGDDLDLIRDCGSSIVTNPASNAKLGNGIAPLDVMRAKEINVCIGTDGCASNNTLNMFREMGLLSLIHKAREKDPVAADSAYVLKAATIGAARFLGRDGLGRIEENAPADLVFVDLNSPSLFPYNNIISSLCYSANGSEVDSVMIGGRFVMRKKEFLTIDKEKVFFEVDKVKEKYL